MTDRPGHPRWRHLLWDLDGTLLDTYPATDGWLQAALGTLGRPLPLAALRPLTRVTLEHAVLALSERFRLAPEAIWTAYGQAEQVRPAPFAPAFPGALAAMQAVRAGGGLNLLATHRDRPGAQARLEVAGLWPLLDDLISVSDGHPRKPDPAMFLALLARHRLAPGDVLAVGDRELDVQAAHAAGLRAALLLTPGVPLTTHADWVLESLHELRPPA